MHFGGGLWLGLFWLWFIFRSGKLKLPVLPFYVTLISVASFAVLGGVLWEFFEFSFDKFIGYRKYADIAQLGISDTMSDLFFDLLGGLAAVCFYNRFLKKARNKF